MPVPYIRNKNELLIRKDKSWPYLYSYPKPPRRTTFVCWTECFVSICSRQKYFNLFTWHNYLSH